MKILFVAVLLSTTAATARAAWAKHANRACALQPGGGGGIEGVNFLKYDDKSELWCTLKCKLVLALSCQAYDYATYSGKEGRCRIYTSVPPYLKYKNGVTCWKKVSSTGGDVYEPDNNLWDASVITSGSTQTHSISPVGDMDWATFTLGPSTNGWDVKLETSGPSGDDTVMALLDSSASAIEENDDYDVSQGLYSKIHRQCGVDALSQGKYYVKVWEYNNNNEINTYDLSFVATKCGGGPSWKKYVNSACALQPGGGGGISGVNGNIEVHDGVNKSWCKNQCRNVKPSCEAYDYATYSDKERCRFYTDFPYYEKYKKGVTCWKKIP